MKEKMKNLKIKGQNILNKIKEEAREKKDKLKGHKDISDKGTVQ